MSEELKAGDQRKAFEAAILAANGQVPGNYNPKYDRYASERRQGQYEGWKLARARLGNAVVMPDDFRCESKELERLLNATALIVETPCQDSATLWAACLADVEARLNPSRGVPDGLDVRAIHRALAAAHSAIVYQGESTSYEYALSEVSKSLHSCAELLSAAPSPAIEPAHGDDVSVPREPTMKMRRITQDKLASEGVCVSDWMVCTVYSSMIEEAEASQPARTNTTNLRQESKNPDASIWILFDDSGFPIFGTARSDRPPSDSFALRPWVELAPVMRVNQCAEVCERAKLCAICSSGIDKTPLPVWMEDPDAFVVRLKAAGWESTHDAKWTGAEALRLELRALLNGGRS